jgi:hypothetical protein
LSLDGDKKPIPILQTPFDEMDAQFSPDGSWLAYESNESGRIEIYVRPFRGTGDKSRVSPAGGSQPRWRPDGAELFYVSPDGHLMAAPIAFAPDGQSARPGTPVALFPPRLASGGNVTVGGPSGHPQYAVARDGRFLLNMVADVEVAPPIAIVLNWDAALKK